MLMQELDAVKLKDGRKGTVIDIYDEEYCSVELAAPDGDGDLIDIKQSEITEIVQRVN
nr:hypothetical protein [Pediococcus pentosaceus]